VLRRLLITLHAALGVMAVAAGAALFSAPSGDPLSFDVEWLDGSPFDNYRVPGLFLASVIGATNLTSAAGLSLRRSWAPLVSLGTGLLLLAWIAIQTWIIGLHDWTQPMWAVTFLVVTVLALRDVQSANSRGRHHPSPPSATGSSFGRPSRRCGP